jgi:hypothetical protein
MRFTSAPALPAHAIVAATQAANITPRMTASPFPPLNHRAGSESNRGQIGAGRRAGQKSLIKYKINQTNKRTQNTIRKAMSAIRAPNSKNIRIFLGRLFSL